MTLSERLDAFGLLGEALGSLGLNETKSLAEKARYENAWFTEEGIRIAVKGVGFMLQKKNLQDWAQAYPSDSSVPKTVGVVMAGNIPLVGFHDFLCVLMAGHSLKVKLSSQDSVLPKFIAQKLIEIEPRFSERIAFAENLKAVDALIATGSDNTARYFEYYFRNVPHVIRKNRASCAVILGEEPSSELELLGRDVFTHFGLGCRNVSKLFVPEEYDFKPLFESWSPFSNIINHNKYVNNYDYQKSILLVKGEPFLDNEFILLKENKDLVSPIAVLYFEKYTSPKKVREKIDEEKDKLQIVVSAKGWFEGSVHFGKSQYPAVQDYADKLDTMKFLAAL